MQTLLKCQNCKKDFKVYPYRFKRGNPKFCSNKCWGKSILGKNPWNKGKKGIYTDESRKRMSESQIKLNRKGEDVPNWRGGSWIYWQSEIKKRDHFTCRSCNLYDPDIVEACHIIPIGTCRNISGHPLNSYDNLITLCPNCHARYDRGLIKI